MNILIVKPYVVIKRFLNKVVSVFLIGLLGFPAYASLFEIDFTSPDTSSFFGTVVGPGIEVGLNNHFFNPEGMEIDLAAAYVAISSGIHGDVSISDKGLGVISYGGFILRFDDSIKVTSVEVVFNDYFDGGTRNLYAYDTDVQYTRDNGLNWSNKGSVIANPEIDSAIDVATGSLLTDTLSLTVTGSDIRSVWANTPPLFSGVSSLAVTFDKVGVNTVPLPSTLALLGFGVLGLIRTRKRIRQA